MSDSSLPPVHCDLVGKDGNAYALMGHWGAAARRAGWPKPEIDRVLEDARSGDYEHLLRTLTRNCTSLPEADVDFDYDGDEEDDDE